MWDPCLGKPGASLDEPPRRIQPSLCLVEAMKPMPVDAVVDIGAGAVVRELTKEKVALVARSDATFDAFLGVGLVPSHPSVRVDDVVDGA